MAGSRITTILSTAVTLGSGGYETPLLITAGGGIEPGMTANAAPALYAPAGMTNLAVKNHGKILGPEGDQSNQHGHHGGAAVAMLSAAGFSNAGVIAGGNGGYGFYGGGNAGTGVDLAAGGRLANSGELGGGSGGNAYYGNGGNGADGVDISNAGTLINSGAITGGAGGRYVGDVGGGYSDGRGGIGVDLSGSGRIVNSGTIAGGYGGNEAGGRGVVLNGGTLVNAGTIEGGNSYYGQADAVVFGQGAATLVVDPGAVFSGTVVANAKAGDVLDLAGIASGTVSGLGSGFKGFAMVRIDAGASWTLAGTNAVAARAALDDLGSLTVAGGLVDTGSLTVGDQAVLQAGAAGSIEAAGVALAGGYVSAGSTGTVTIGTGLADAAPGSVVIEAGATLTGFGSVGSPLVDNGVVAVAGGTLTLTGAVSGTGALTLGDKTTLLAEGGVSAGSVSFDIGHATLALADPALVSSLISGFGAGDKIDLLDLTATGLAFQNGTLTIEDGSTVIATLDFAGDNMAANFALRPDMHGGTDIVFRAVENGVLHAGSSGIPEPAHIAGAVSMWAAHIVF